MISPGARHFATITALAIGSAAGLFAGLAATASAVAGPVIGSPRLVSPRALPARANDLRMRPNGPCVPPLLFVSSENPSQIEVYTDSLGFAAPGPFVHKISGGSSKLANPGGLFVRGQVLYVANESAHDILLFKVCNQTPGSALKDAGQIPIDVAVSANGTVYVSNEFNNAGNTPNIARCLPGNLNCVPNFLGPPTAASEGRGIAIDSAGNCFWAYTDSLGAGQVAEYLGCAGAGTLLNLYTNHVLDKLGGPFGIELDLLDDLIINDGGAGSTKTYAGPELGLGVPPPYNYDWLNGALLGGNSRLIFLRLSQNEKILNVADDLNGQVLRYSYPAYLPLTPLGGIPDAVGVATYPAPPL